MKSFLRYINFGKVLLDPRFAKAFVLLLSINIICILGSQFYNLPKIDVYWFWILLFRISMLVTTYYLGMYLVRLLYFKTLQNTILTIVIIFSLISLVINIFLFYNFHTSLNSYLIVIALQSNPEEISEFLINYFSLGLLGIYLICGILLMLIYKKTKAFSIKPNAISTFITTCIVCLIIVYITRLYPKVEWWSDVVYNTATSFSRAYNKTMIFMAEYKSDNEAIKNNIKDIAPPPPILR